ncbi:hypothetical protein BGX30_010531 [Mortierella sp. GBA39]|nr:hypothetical protein BGX30_010531 [Mortierella sp. GBA39]
MVYVKPEHSAGLGGASAGSQGYLLSIGGNTVPGINFWAYYNIQTQQWTPLTSQSAPYTGLEGQTAVSDPNTGLVYVIGGFWNLDGKIATTLGITNFLTVIDPTQSIGTRIVSQAPATGLNNLTGAVAVWSTMRKSVLVFGGSRAVSLTHVAGLGMTNVDEYDPVRGTWGTMLTSGPSLPGARLDACAATSDDGSKIIVFGGELDVASFLSSIYVLDVATQIWKRGPDVPTQRSQSACAYHDGQFIVFGGTGSKNMSEDMHTTQPLVFDVQALIWVLQFAPKEVPSPPSSPNGGGNATGDGGGMNGGETREKSNVGLIVACASGGFVVLLGVMVAVILSRKKRERRKRDVFLAGDKHTRRPDGTAVIPGEADAFIHPSGGARAGGRVVNKDDDEDDYPPFRRPRSPPGPLTNNYHPYKPFTPTEYYSSAYGHIPTVAPPPVPATGSTALKATGYYPTAFGSAPWTTTAAAIAKGVPIMAAAAVANSPRPVSASSRPASFTTTTAQSDPSFYYKQMQVEINKPQPQPPAPPQPQPPRPSTSAPPRTSYTSSYSPSYSDNTDSTNMGHESAMISPPARPTMDLPPPIPRRPPSGSEFYSMISVGDTTAPMAPEQQKQQQRWSPSPSAPGPQCRGDEHAQHQEIYRSQQQQQRPHYSQHQQPYQQPYRQPSPNPGQYRYSTATAEEDEIQSPQPSIIEGYNEFHGPWTNDRRRYPAPHAVRDVPVETYRDYKVEAPRRPQMGQESFH